MAAEDQDSNVSPTGLTGGVGALLRETRQQLGQDLKLVAATLRIRQPYLQAIEDGRFQDLPGSTYAVGFVRGYAEYLGLDSKEIVRRFRQENSDFASHHELVFPSAASEGSIPNGALLGLAVIAAVVAYGTWYWYQTRDATLAQAVPALPERLAGLLHKPASTADSEVVPATAGDAGHSDQNAAGPSAQPMADSAGPHEDVVPPAEDQATAGGETPPAPAADTSLQPPPATPAAAEGTSATAAEAAKTAIAPAADVKPAKESKAKDAKTTPPGDVANSDSSSAVAATRVVLKASEDCWIEIRDANGQMIHSRLLHGGETFPVPNRSGLTLTAGNAGALSLVVDGKASGPLGRIGMVRHDVPLDADRLNSMAVGGAPTP